MKIQELHNKAIEIADIAFIKKFNGLFDEANQLFFQAYELEKEAAYAAKTQNIGEPSISVLFKSAASLAINCNQYSEAEKLICFALSGDPLHEIAEELRNLLEELYFQRHLQLQGISINSTELQLVIAGKGVSYGMAKSDAVFDRINIFEKITHRTVERRIGKPFRNKGDVAKTIKENFQSYLSVPRAASFAFTIRLGGITNQLKFDGFESSNDKIEDVIEDIVENIELVNSADYDRLKEKIPDPIYFKNFVGLSKELAPDGQEVNLVGLTIVRNGKQKDVQFTRIRSDIKSSSFNEEPTIDSNDKSIELIGRLSAADEDKNKIRLKVGTENYSIIVPDGLGDIVKKYFGEQVRIRGVQIKEKIVNLIDIDPE